MPDDSLSAAERFVAAAFYAPIGLGAKLVDDLPNGVAKARQNIGFARFVGKMAIEQGTKEFRRRLNSADRAGNEPFNEAVDATSVEIISPQASASGEDAVGADRLSPADLALPDYDHLPAAHIVGKLAGLTVGERDDIEAYEAEHRHRRTVLGKLDQLKGD